MRQHAGDYQHQSIMAHFKKIPKAKNKRPRKKKGKRISEKIQVSLISSLAADCLSLCCFI